MTSNATLELALRDEPQAVMLTNQQLIVIANTDFVPKSMRGNVPMVLACVARGRAMGIPDMVALNGIAIIEGKATLSAELMVAIVREHGHSITGDVTATSAKVRGKRRDNGDTMTAEFNIEMAKQADLLNKFNWKKHPDDMMWARAVSKLCRRLFADCFAGGTYSAEETQGGDLTADEVIDLPNVRPDDAPVPAEDGEGEQVPQPSSPPPYEPKVPNEADLDPADLVLEAGQHQGETIGDVYDSGDEGVDYLRRLLLHWMDNGASGVAVDALKHFALSHTEIQP